MCVIKHICILLKVYDIRLQRMLFILKLYFEKLKTNLHRIPMLTQPHYWFTKIITLTTLCNTNLRSSVDSSLLIMPRTQHQGIAQPTKYRYSTLVKLCTVHHHNIELKRHAHPVWIRICPLSTHWTPTPCSCLKPSQGSSHNGLKALEHSHMYGPQAFFGNLQFG